MEAIMMKPIIVLIGIKQEAIRVIVIMVQKMEADTSCLDVILFFECFN
jgi:hypothetical protein